MSYSTSNLRGFSNNVRYSDALVSASMRQGRHLVNESSAVAIINDDKPRVQPDTVLRTKRLILRQWNDEDLQPFAQMCADKDVMEFFPKLLTEEESFSMGNTIRSLIAERGWGFWAVEVPGENRFIGFVGLHIPKDNMPFSPCVEIGWRLAKEGWGMGYATEAASEALRYAFTHLDLDEVVSFATVNNTRSQAVMKRIGMSYASNFMHPDLSPSDPLREHVLYKITRNQWRCAHLQSS